MLYDSSAKVRQTEIEAMRLRELSNKHCVKPRAVLSARHGDAMGFYGVGMVMRHKRYDYECVIYGWNECCAQSQVCNTICTRAVAMLYPKR